MTHQVMNHRTPEPVRGLALAVCVLLMAAPLVANDWPEWRGAGRTGVWTETDIVDELPAGLKVKWRVPINSGFSGPAVVDGRVFITDWAQDPASRTMDGTERTIALDEESGEILWTREWPTSYRMLMLSYAIGPRATPTVDGDRVYVVGAAGDLCTAWPSRPGRSSGRSTISTDYDSFVPTWGVASSPIVDGDRLITVVGGEPGGLIMAFDKETGAEVWRALDVVGEMGYGQPIIIEAGGARQLIVWHAVGTGVAEPGRPASCTGRKCGTRGAGMSVATPVCKAGITCWSPSSTSAR